MDLPRTPIITTGRWFSKSLGRKNREKSHVFEFALCGISVEYCLPSDDHQEKGLLYVEVSKGLIAGIGADSEREPGFFNQRNKPAWGIEGH